MPSILSRLFPAKRKPAEASHLLGGEKYEAVDTPSSPSAQATFLPQNRPKSPAKQTRSKKVSSPSVPPQRSAQPPSLSLTLPDPKVDEKKSPGLGIVFESVSNGSPLINEDVLASRMLSPSEALYLVQKTAENISEKGLETLGVMRPHWFASSHHQEIQQKLLSRYIQVLTAQQADGAPSTSFAPSPSTAFESELRYTSDQHDVAAVLRWALRHLQLDRNRLGTVEDWYKLFSESESAASYPSKAFDDILVPLLPETHAQLVRVLFDLVSSLAAHSEQTGISGNKLSKVLAWWMVGPRPTSRIEFSAFYRQWESMARQFEHMFLAFVRVQETRSRMPKRLTELVKHYPFTANRREDDGIFLPCPPFSTRKIPALLLRIEADKEVHGTHPLRVVEEAFKASTKGDSNGDLETLWRNICNTALKPTEESSNLNLSLILADESIRLFSLIPSTDGSTSPAVSLFPSLPSERFRRSLSNSERPQSTISAKASSDKHPVTAPALGSNQLDITTDWQAFSTAGFQSPSGLSLAASLWDNDTEVTQPPAKKGDKSSKPNHSTRPGRRSMDAPSPLPIPVPQTSHTEPKLDVGPSKTVQSLPPNLVQLDEAFIDFWADTLLDNAVTRAWPAFVVCQLKPSANFCLPERDITKPIEWLIIERIVAEPAPNPGLKAAEPSSPSETVKSSIPAGNKGFKWSLKKRWSHFGTSPNLKPSSSTDGSLSNMTTSGKDKASKGAGVKVGEMGEMLKEEEEESKSVETPKVHANGVDKEPESEAVKVNGVSQKAEGKEPRGPRSSTDTAERLSLDVAAVAAAAGGPEVLAGIVEDSSPGGAGTTKPGEVVAPEVDSKVDQAATVESPSQRVEVQPVLSKEHNGAPKSTAAVVKNTPVTVIDQVPTSTPALTPAVEEIKVPVETAPEANPVTVAKSPEVAIEPERDVRKDHVVTPVVLAKEIKADQPEPQQAESTATQSKPVIKLVAQNVLSTGEQPSEPAATEPTVPVVPEPTESEAPPVNVTKSKIGGRVQAFVEKLERTSIPKPGSELKEVKPIEEPQQHPVVSQPENERADVIRVPEPEEPAEPHVEQVQEPVLQADVEDSKVPDVVPTPNPELAQAEEIHPADEPEVTTPELDASAQPVDDSTLEIVSSVEQPEDHENGTAEVGQPEVSPLAEEPGNGDPESSVKVAAPTRHDEGVEKITSDEPTGPDAEPEAASEHAEESPESHISATGHTT